MLSKLKEDNKEKRVPIHPLAKGYVTNIIVTKIVSLLLWKRSTSSSIVYYFVAISSIKHTEYSQRALVLSEVYNPMIYMILWTNIHVLSPIPKRMKEFTSGSRWIFIKNNFYVDCIDLRMYRFVYIVSGDGSLHSLLVFVSRSFSLPLGCPEGSS